MFYLRYPFEREQAIEPFSALGDLHDTEIDALLQEADAADLALALRDEEFKGFLNRLLGRSGASQRQQIESALGTAAAASPAEVAAAQSRVVEAGIRILALEGVRLPSVHVWEDLVHLSDEEMRLFLDHIGATDLALSLKTSDEPLKNRIVGVLSPQERDLVTKHMEWLGPVRISTVQRVQLAIVQAVRAENPFV